MKRLTIGLLLVSMVLSLGACSGGTTKTVKSNDLVKLTWIAPGAKQSDVQSVMEEANKIIEPSIGAKLDLQFIDEGAYGERMKMNMASGNDYDLCFASNWLNDYQSAAMSGGLKDITDIVENKVPKLKETLPDYVLKASRINGKIYGVSNMQVMANVLCITVGKDLVSKYNFDSSKVKNMNDIEPFLETVKNSDCGLYPYRSIWGMAPWVNPVYEMVVENSNVAIKSDGSSTKLELIYQTDEFKNALNTLRRWYEKGYIRADAASVGDDSTDAKMGKYAVNIATWKPGSDQLFPKPTECMKLQKPYLGRGAPLQTMISVGANSKNPEKAVQLIELMNTNKELYNLICFGIKGKHYNMTQESKVEYIENSGYAPKADWKFGNQFNALLVKGMNNDVWEQTKILNDEALKSPLLGFVPDLSKLTNEISQVASVNSEYKIMYQGADDPKNYWSSYIKKLEEAGQRKIFDELQIQVNEFMKNKTK